MKKAEKAGRLKAHVIGIRVDDELKAAIENAAAREERSTSQWLVRAARAALERKLLDSKD